MVHELTTGVAVLGGGPGGYTAAFRAADLGLDVCLIEQGGRLGGVCLNVGCIPSKTLLHAAFVIEEAQAASEFGVSFGTPQIDIEALRSHKAKIVTQLTNGLDGLCKARKITRLTGHGTFVDQKTLLVSGKDGDTRVSFTDAIIATGSHPFVLPGCPDDPRIWDSTDALALTTVPKRLLVIGGGIIGLEMAQVYSALGAEITIVEMLPQIIPPADRDLVQPLFLKLKKKYRIYTETRVAGITDGPAGIEVILEGKIATTESFDAVLVAVGRRPNTAGFGLETIGLALDGHGFLPVNERQQTAVPHFYAIGDVVGEPMLAHKASHQGKVAAEVIAGHKSAFTPMTIPSVAYTSPEVAWMGLTEKEAEQQGLSFKKGKFPWGASGRALSSGASNGVSKVLFDEVTGRILGAGICGLNAGELIHEAVLALEMGANAEDISKTVHAHPTLAETFAFAAEMVDGSITDVLPPKK
ncbi:dihydrolipoyl dehydrogenase [uncultured Desulfobulbus sp.]|uniref:dihydrolipoyl dehydrogenase n=1 Tax=uncultured Desulfobulbus sp. TaxID=239745 RepID=UPI0029C81904|nr:dihydrolipoyl dehydrogenase [uncultured Desulfobulbus sp.]